VEEKLSREFLGLSPKYGLVVFFFVAIILFLGCIRRFLMEELGLLINVRIVNICPVDSLSVT
jgi:hypothetical protein